MTDPLDLASMGTHIGTGVGGAGLVGFAMRFLWGKEQTQAAVRLERLELKLDQALESLRKHEGLSERLALLERDVEAVHERMDGKTRKNLKNRSPY